MSTTVTENVYNLIILDESGSMESIKSSIISGFNELVQSIRRAQSEFPGQSHFISLVTFSDDKTNFLLWNEPVSKLEYINEETYRPNCSTPLYDAIGRSVRRMKEVLPSHTKSGVLVTILTDGEENASREFTGPQIREMIDSLKTSDWTFTYIGANHDVEAAARKMAIKNTLNFKASETGVEDMFGREMNARMAYYQKRFEGLDVTGDFYQREEEDNKK